MHSLETNEGRSGDRRGGKGRRIEEGDEIANFVAVKTVVVVEDGPEAEAV